MWYYLKGLKFLSSFSMQKYARKAAGGKFSVFNEHKFNFHAKTKKTMRSQRYN